MLRSRLSVVLLLDHNRLVKTVRFSNPIYVGDPLNTVRIFNEKSVDELIVLDITASKDRRSPNFSLISKLARQCQMPLSYGGGIKTLSDVQSIISLGVEKVVLGNIAFTNPEIITHCSNSVGAQSISVILDYFPSSNFQPPKLLHSSSSLESILDFFTSLGCGEFIFQSVTNDGTLSGSPLTCFNYFQQYCTVPFTVIGGTSSITEVELINACYGPLGIGVGSLFTFQGPHKAVLPNYPSTDSKRSLLASNNLLINVDTQKQMSFDYSTSSSPNTKWSVPFVSIQNFLCQQDFDNLLSYYDLHTLNDHSQSSVYTYSKRNPKTPTDLLNTLLYLEEKYTPLAKDILFNIAPHKSHLLDNIRFTLAFTPPGVSYEVHEDSLEKILTGVVYLHPSSNKGTLLHSSKNDKNPSSIEWIPNRAFFFSREHNKTWHSYGSTPTQYRMTLVIVLSTRSSLKHLQLQVTPLLLPFLAIKKLFWPLIYRKLRLFIPRPNRNQ